MATISLVYTRIHAFESAAHAALYFDFEDGREFVFRGGPNPSNPNVLESRFLTGSQARVAGGDLDPDYIVVTQDLGIVSDDQAWDMLQGLRYDISGPINDLGITYTPYTLNPFECAKNS